MSLKYNLVLGLVICLSYKVVKTGGEVVLVNRNVTDSFRVGQDGCTNNSSVCPSSATCQSDGSCLCNKEFSNFRNPVIEMENVYGKTYGCTDGELIRVSGVGTIRCPLAPFQVIPYNHNDPPTQFSLKLGGVLLSCSGLAKNEKSRIKFPDNATEMELRWLNDSYVDLNVLNSILYFKWKRSVPNLQGTIITLIQNCEQSSGSYTNICLRAKVLGSWAADTSATVEPSNKPTTSDVSPNNTMTTSPTSSARSSPPAEVSSSDGDSSGTIIFIAVVVPIVLLIVLVVFVWLVCKRKKRNGQRNSSSGNSGKKNGTSSMKQFRHTDSNLRGPDAYADVQEKDTTQTFGAQTNAAYATPDSQRVVVEANPTYATPDIKKREFNGANSYPEPGYETPDVKRKDAIEATSDSAYSTLDDKKRDVNPGYSTPDSDTRKGEDNTGLPTPDIKRVEVNGDLYALPDKNTKKDNGLNYMDPSELVSGSQEKNESNNQSGQPSEYADIVGVMKAKPKKKK